MAYFRFFLPTLDFLLPCNPTLCIKKVTKNSLNYYLLKVKKLYGDSVKNESARAKKQEGGRQTPPPSLFRVKSVKNRFHLKNTLLSGINHISATA